MGRPLLAICEHWCDAVCGERDKSAVSPPCATLTRLSLPNHFVHRPEAGRAGRQQAGRGGRGRRHAEAAGAGVRGSGVRGQGGAPRGGSGVNAYNILFFISLLPLSGQGGVGRERQVGTPPHESPPHHSLAPLS